MLEEFWELPEEFIAWRQQTRKTAREADECGEQFREQTQEWVNGSERGANPLEAHDE